MVASALLLVPLAIGTTPAQSHTSHDSDTTDALSEGAAWPDDHDADDAAGDDEACDCTGRRGRGYEHGRGHHSHGRGHGYGHDGHHDDDDDGDEHHGHEHGHGHGHGHGYGHEHGHGCGGGDPDPDPAPVPTAAFGFTPAAPVAGRDVQFDASTSTGGVDGDVTGTLVSYSWQFGDGATADGATAAHSFADAGDFTVSLTVVNDYGQSNTTSQTVSVIAAPVPVASFTYTPPAPVAGGGVQFDASASSGGTSGEYSGAIVSYSWQFGDGTTGDGVSVSHVFPAGDASVTLTVTNDFGKSDSLTQTVHVVPPPPPYDPGGGGTGVPRAGSLSASLSTLSVSQTTQRGGKLRVRGRVGFAPPDGTDAAQVCVGAVSVSGKARGVGSLRGRAALHARDGRCVAEFRHSLPASAAGKRIKLTYDFAGNDAVAAWSEQRTLKVKPARS
ncbi:MAG: PKD domain-containing protein [Actinobacteria bacterium]|nr:PKD domain-containing protein [Actinomycetota bacterium]